MKPKLTERRMTKEEARTLKRFGDNHDYINRNIGELRKNYLDQYVAVYDGNVVDHGADLQELVERLHGKYPPEEYFTMAIEPVLKEGTKFLFVSGSSAAAYAQPALPIA